MSKPPQPRRYRVSLSRAPRKRILESIRVHEDIAKRHPAATETHRYALASIRKLRAELAARDQRRASRARAHGRTDNPRSTGKPHRLKWNRCLTDITVKGTVPRAKPVRRHNRLGSVRHTVVLYASKAGRQTLKYTHRGKFAARGKALRFRTEAAALGAAHVLRDVFPQALQGYRFMAK